MKKITSCTALFLFFNLCSVAFPATVTFNFTNLCTYEVGIASAVSLEADASKNYDTDGWKNLAAGKILSVQIDTGNYSYVWFNVISSADEHYLTANQASLCADFKNEFSITYETDGITGVGKFHGFLGGTFDHKEGATCEAIGGALLPGWENVAVTGTTMNLTIRKCN